MTNENRLCMQLLAFMQADRPRRKEHDLSAIERMVRIRLAKQQLG
jgi:hypothetical protein